MIFDFDFCYAIRTVVICAPLLERVLSSYSVWHCTQATTLEIYIAVLDHRPLE